MSSLGRSSTTGSENTQEGFYEENENSRPESCLDQPMDSSVYVVVQEKPSHLPAKHYDPETTDPISCGLCSMEELLSWSRSGGNPFNVAAVPLAPRKPRLDQTLRRTLVSHDMMGGYLDDRFVQGTDAENPYAFYHWQYIDIFNYFSHHLVTIPPAVWTNAAHTHGVIVLGTFITEWDGGAAKCENFLKDEESYRAVADKLVQISQYYGFDGWLINIENPLSERAVKNTPLFLRYLTDQMHVRVPSSLVLWYDSVIENGHLEWQNELNQSNRMFFDDCDGFFTNYNWTEEHLVRMKEYCRSTGRQADIYVGVDVFARGEVVGGMFETNKSLEVIRRHNFSVAIFAPGWVYESQSNKSDFRCNQDKFWALLSDYLYTHRPVSPLPLISSFCQGFGKSVYWRGQHETRRSWFNLSAQELQPLYYHQALEGQGWLQSSGCPEDAWNGGCSLLLSGLIPETVNTPVCAKIFSLQVPLDSEILVTLVYKASAGITVSLQLKTTDAAHCTNTDVQEITFTGVSSAAVHNGSQIMSQLYQLCGNNDPNDWTLRCSQLELRRCILKEMCVLIHRVGEPRDLPFHCRLGEIMVMDVATLQNPPAAVTGLCVDDIVWLRGFDAQDDTALSLRLNASLRWEYQLESVRHFKVYWRRLRGPDPRIPAGQLELVGRAYSNLFRVTELVVPEPPGLLELVVEPVIREGITVPESHWGRRRISYVKNVEK